MIIGDHHYLLPSQNLGRVSNPTCVSASPRCFKQGCRTINAGKMMQSLLHGSIALQRTIGYNYKYKKLQKDKYTNTNAQSPVARWCTASCMALHFKEQDLCTSRKNRTVCRAAQTSCGQSRLKAEKTSSACYTGLAIIYVQAFVQGVLCSADTDAACVCVGGGIDADAVQERADADTVWGRAEADVLTLCEAYADAVWGRADADTVWFRADADFVLMLCEVELIDADTVWSRADADALWCKADAEFDADTVWGRADADAVWGGTGGGSNKVFWAISLGEPIGRDLAVVGFIKTTICMIKDEHAIALWQVHVYEYDILHLFWGSFFTIEQHFSLPWKILFFCFLLPCGGLDSCQGRMEVCNRWLWVTPCLLPAGCQRGVSGSDGLAKTHLCCCNLNWAACGCSCGKVVRVVISFLFFLLVW